jgi:hypothetical protein
MKKVVGHRAISKEEMMSKLRIKEPKMSVKEIHRKLLPLLQEDNCSICKRELAHMDMTYGGLTHDGTVALVGDCCKSKMKDIMAGSMYLNPQRIGRRSSVDKMPSTAGANK